MANDVQEERLRWVLPIVHKQMKLCDVVKICPYSERSLKRWKQSYLLYGAEGLIPQSTKPYTQPNETPICIKEEVISLRKKNRTLRNEITLAITKRQGSFCTR